MLVLICASLFMSASSNTRGVAMVSNPTVNSTHECKPGSHCFNSTNGQTTGNNLKSLLDQLYNAVQQPQVIIGFLTGIVLSATVCCLATACHRRKRRSGMDMEMEMVTTEGPLINGGQPVEWDDGTHGQAAEAAGTSAPDGEQELKEVEYSDIAFFASKCGLTEASDAREPTDTEYAEIKKDKTEERQDDGGEMLEDNGEKEEEMMLEAEVELEMGLSVSAKEEGEDEAVYSTVT